MTETRSIVLQNLSIEKFEPFGWVIAGGQKQADFARPGLENWRFPFESDAPLRLQVMRYHQQPLTLSMMERHLCVTEARQVMGAAQAILVVAENIVGETGRETPDPMSIQAFLLDSRAGIMFRPGIWHGLDCLPANAPFADLLFMSDAATEDEIEALGDAVTGVRTDVVDLSVSHNLSIEIIDPDGLIGPALT